MEKYQKVKRPKIEFNIVMSGQFRILLGCFGDLYNEEEPAAVLVIDDVVMGGEQSDWFWRDKLKRFTWFSVIKPDTDCGAVGVKGNEGKASIREGWGGG